MWRHLNSVAVALRTRVGDWAAAVIDFIILERNLAVRAIRLQGASNPFGIFSSSLRYLFVVNAHVWAFWAMGRRGPGTSWLVFFTAGFATYILFGVGRRSAPSKALNLSSMSLNIKWIHLFIAMMIAESAKIVIAFIAQIVFYAMFPVKYMGHVISFPDIPLLIACFVISGSVGIGIGLIVATATRLWPALDAVTETFYWALFITSGIYLPLSSYPPTVIPLFALSPLLTAIEYSRHALDPTYAINDAINFGRAAATAFGVLFLGLAFRQLAARGQLPWIRQ